MKVGDVVICRNNKAVVVNVAKEYATVVFLKPGMYMPENFLLKDIVLAKTSKDENVKIN